jgi:hypothetical protein
VSCRGCGANEADIKLDLSFFLKSKKNTLKTLLFSKHADTLPTTNNTMFQRSEHCQFPLSLQDGGIYGGYCHFGVKAVFL